MSLSSRSTSSTVTTTFILSRFFGLFPYDLDTFERNHWTLPGTLILFCISVSLFWALRGPVYFADPFVVIIYRVLNFLPWLSTTVFLLTSLFLGPYVSIVFEIFGKLDRRFVLRSPPNRFRFVLILDATIRLTLLVFETYEAYLFIKGKRIHELLVRLFGLYLTHTIQNVYELQFLSFIHQTAEWFTLLKSRLNVKTAVSLVDCRKDLSMACAAMEKAYNFQNFTTVVNCFVICMVDFYNLYALVADFAAPLALNLLFRISLRIYQTLVLSFSVSRLCHKAEAFDEALYVLTLEDHTRALANDKKVKLHLAKRCRIGFTGGHMFMLDSTLSHSLAALTVNYLIILIQSGGKEHKIG